MTPEEQLVDYRRMVAAMYARVRDSNVELAERCQQFRRERDDLFRTHPQSALDADQQTSFTGLRYYPYNLAYRFVLRVEPLPDSPVFEMQLETDGLLRIKRFGKINFVIGDKACSLTLYWLLGYGGGIFLPFGDSTNRHETYGGGRYLLDTIKHADLGHEGDTLVIDFNYAYNPSCAYNPRWFCPLAPSENRLPVPIPVGEMIYFEGT